jgi:hypothetical protein
MIKGFEKWILGKRNWRNLALNREEWGKFLKRAIKPIMMKNRLLTTRVVRITLITIFF